MSHPAVSVVIVTFAGAATLPRCLAALAAQTFRDFEIVLSDNASPQGEAQRAAAAEPALVLVENGSNLGFAAGNNRAALKARGRWLALLNPDAFAEPEWLERLVARAEAAGPLTAWTSLQQADDDPRLLDGAGDGMSLMGLPWRMGHRRPRPVALKDGVVFSPCGAAMLIARETFLNLGGFDERFFCYCEDVDLGWRLNRTGGETRLASDAVVRHVGSASVGVRSDFALYHGARNRLWCWLKNTPPPLFALTLPLHLAATLLAVLPAGRAARRGLVDGLKGWRAYRAQAPRHGSAASARAMTWNPWTVLRRGLDIRSSREGGNPVPFRSDP